MEVDLAECWTSRCSFAFPAWSRREPDSMSRISHGLLAIYAEKESKRGTGDEDMVALWLILVLALAETRHTHVAQAF